MAKIIKIEIEVDLEKYTYDEEMEEKLIQDIKEDLQDELDRTVKYCIENYHKNRGTLEKDWIISIGGGMYKVLEVNQSRAIILNIIDNSDKCSISPQAACEIISKTIID